MNHFYTKHGDLVRGVALRDAIKAGYYPSVTTVLRRTVHSPTYR